MQDLWTSRFVAGAAFSILAFLIIVVCFFELPKGNHDIIITLIGIVIGSCGTIVTYYFGSSKSSHDKDDAIQKIALTAGGTGTGGQP